MRTLAGLVLLTCALAALVWAVVRPAEADPARASVVALAATRPGAPPSIAVPLPVTVAATTSATASASATASVDVGAPFPAETSTTEKPPIVVVGRAVDAQGWPIVNAEVELHARLRPTTDSGLRPGRLALGDRIVTGPDGRFRVGPLARPAALFALSLSVFDPAGRAERCESVDREQALVDLGDLVVSGEGPGTRKSRVSVLVRAEGQPVANAFVGMTWSGSRCELLTDAAGRGSVLVGQTLLRVDARAGPLVAQRERVPVTSSDLEVVLDLTPERFVRGVVLDLAGAPAVGARVEAMSLDRFDWPVLEMSDGRGDFSFAELPPGPIALVAWHEPLGGVMSISPHLVVRPGAGEDCVLQLGGASKLVVRRGSDAPSPLIELLTASGEWVPSWALDSRGDRDPTLFGAELRWFASGQFRVRPLFGDGSTISSWTVAGGTVELEAPVGTRQGRRVQGRVVRTDGTPIRSASVRVRDGPWHITDSPTGELGSFTVWTPERALTLHVDAGGPVPVLVDLPPGAEPLDLGDIRVPDAP